LVFPDVPSHLSWGTLTRIPVAGIIIVLAAAILPHHWGRRLGIAFGVLLALLLLIKIVNNGFQEVFFRDFDPINDWTYLPSGVDVLTDTIGEPATIVTVIAAGILAVAAFVGLPLCLVRTIGLVQHHRRRAAQIAAVLGL